MRLGLRACVLWLTSACVSGCLSESASEGEKARSSAYDAGAVGAAFDAGARRRDGCERSVSGFEGLEADPACLITAVREDVVRAAWKQLSVQCTLSPETVTPSATALFVLTVTNTSKSDALVVLDAKVRPSAGRTDWSRIVGIPEPRAASESAPRLFVPLTTTDARGHEVDAVPTLPVPAGSPEAIVGVRLRPGGKLVHKASWWAFRIPAPQPIFRDDAGHRYVPKTAAVGLSTGEYHVVADVPAHLLTREERACVARVRVVKVSDLDGG